MQQRISLLPLRFLLAVIAVHCSKDATPSGDGDPVIEKADPITDIEGNVYQTVRINDNIWMAENLNVGYFRNGDPIPEAKTKEAWDQAATERTQAWCYYENDPENGK